MKIDTFLSRLKFDFLINNFESTPFLPDFPVIVYFCCFKRRAQDILWITASLEK